MTLTPTARVFGIHPFAVNTDIGIGAEELDRYSPAWENCMVVGLWRSRKLAVTVIDCAWRDLSR